MTSRSEDSIVLAASHERDLAAARPRAVAPIPPALWMLTVLIAAFFVLVGVCFWMGTQIH